MSMSNTELQKKTDVNNQEAERLRSKILTSTQEINEVEEEFKEI